MSPSQMTQDCQPASITWIKSHKDGALCLSASPHFGSQVRGLLCTVQTPPWHLVVKLIESCSLIITVFSVTSPSVCLFSLHCYYVKEDFHSGLLLHITSCLLVLCVLMSCWSICPLVVLCALTGSPSPVRWDAWLADLNPTHLSPPEGRRRISVCTLIPSEWGHRTIWEYWSSI